MLTRSADRAWSVFDLARSLWVLAKLKRYKIDHVFWINAGGDRVTFIGV
jgi:hypothetical protein